MRSCWPPRPSRRYRPCPSRHPIPESEASLLAKPLIGMFRAAGPCTSRRIGIYEQLNHRVRAARIVEGGRAQPVAVLASGACRNPEFERGFTNEARMVIA